MRRMWKEKQSRTNIKTYGKDGGGRGESGSYVIYNEGLES